MAFSAPNSFSAGAPPRTPLGELTTLPRLTASLRGLLLMGRERGEKGRGKEGKRDRPPYANSWIRPWFRGGAVYPFKPTGVELDDFG